MEYARAHYTKAAKQQFNKTVVEDPDAEAEAPTADLPPPATPPRDLSSAGSSTDEI